MLAAKNDKQLAALPALPLQPISKTNVLQAVQTLVQRQSRMEEVQVEFYRYQNHFNTLTQRKTDTLMQQQHKLEMQIVAGRAAMASLHNQLEREGGRIDELKTDVAQAEQELTRVNGDLQALERTVQDQARTLNKQGTELDSLAHSNKQREAVVECFIVLVCALVARSLPINFVLQLVVPWRSARQTSTSIVKLGAFVLCLRKIRQHAATLGWTAQGTSDLNLVDHLIRLQQ